ncbi:MAG: hypothetical protein KJ058_02425 [Thermoanaerobaculia bacterium]|nr:hypothetical protein [Thermoanaerobaculia bacterium]MCZ7652679.1 hypothetical protein [Thermoanaerobaculia bacterium]
MSSSTRRFLWALAFFCTSAAVGAAEGRPARTPEELRLVELEGQLARSPIVYLVLDPAAKVLDIRVRGIVIERVELQGLELLTYRPLFGDAEAPPLAIPAVWTITQGPGDTDREVIAPVRLRPYPKDGEEEEEESPPAPTPIPSGDEGDPEGEPRATYRVQLDNEWQLYVVNAPPKLDLWRRYLAAVHDGWERLRGRQPAHPALIALVLPEETALRLHHLFRAKMPLLVGDGAATVR